MDDIRPDDVEDVDPTLTQTEAEDDLPPESPKSDVVPDEAADPEAETPAGTEPG